MSAYLFVHFTGEKNDGEQVFFSISQDGLHWKDLNQGKPILKSKLGDQGVRDPFLVKHPITGTYYLMATDLKMETRQDWEDAVHNGSKDMIVWESNDLINWSKERSCSVGIEGAGCVWAPEAIYDEEQEAFLVFWASFIKECGELEGKHRIYASYTKDFITFTPAVKYIEHERSIIDTTIFYHNNKYYRFSKDEKTAKIELELGENLKSDSFQKTDVDLLANLEGLEGPQCYQLSDGRWCLICDQFAAQKGYLPIIIEDLDKGIMQVLPNDRYDFGESRKRHGGVIEITDKEYEQLLECYGAMQDFHIKL